MPMPKDPELHHYGLAAAGALAVVLSSFIVIAIIVIG